MTPEEKKQLNDIVAFIRWGIARGLEMSDILANVGHDCTGLLLGEPQFLPRTSGYSESYEKLLEKKVEKLKDVGYHEPSVYEKQKYALPVVKKGYLLFMKSKGGMRLWHVLSDEIRDLGVQHGDKWRP